MKRNTTQSRANKSFLFRMQKDSVRIGMAHRVNGSVLHKESVVTIPRVKSRAMQHIHGADNVCTEKEMIACQCLESFDDDNTPLAFFHPFNSKAICC